MTCPTSVCRRRSVKSPRYQFEAIGEFARYSGSSVLNRYRLRSGREAEEFGLVNSAVAPDAFDETVDDLVETLASKTPRILEWQSQVFRALRSNGIESGINHSLEVIAACFDTYHQSEAMAAILEKRELQFQGR
ncbi:enoyl-CoA hydratase/isomerase family protein [Natrinema halophilum]|uniref:enoyl-CoA hydratase/isomerase family protein n=1 Tax=Natrinema halophilum TaxID=1699371 RepID=UPI001F28E15C|nr:enoyl-CoA hydratase-related protein [Natrinema halophilum]UHQ96110.1 enoyl-CoA hydratase-related protein [Natrinema halophilum]